jgi:hypothetical protein
MSDFDQAQHLSEDTLELIALNRLPEPNLSTAEEHLLVCDQCREALTEVDRYAAAMRHALTD